MERYIAVDNVCAWPKLTVMSDGSINMDIHNKPSHGSDDGSAVCYKSTDGGRSFEKWGVSGEGSIENGAFIYKVCGEAHVRISNDDGKTWSDSNFIVNYPPTDNGYPSTVQLSDGMLVTAYYCGGNMYHTRYHAGVIRWRISDLIEGRWIGRPAKFFVGTDNEWINEWR